MNRYLKFLQDFTPLLKQINMATIVIAKRTLPRHYITKEGHSKKKEYLQIAGVPLVVTSFNANTVTLNPLTVFCTKPSTKPEQPGKLATTPVPLGSHGSAMPSVNEDD